MGIDVLSVMDQLRGCSHRRCACSHTPTSEITRARAAVAELIEAGRSLQAAMDEDDSNKFDIAPAQRFFAADARHRAALAKVTGATDGR